MEENESETRRINNNHAICETNKNVDENRGDLTSADVPKVPANRFGFKPPKQAINPPIRGPRRTKNQESAVKTVKVNTVEAPMRTCSPGEPSAKRVSQKRAPMTTKNRYNTRSTLGKAVVTSTSKKEDAQRPDVSDGPETEEINNNEVESLSDLFEKLFATKFESEVEELLKHRIKAGRFNMREKAEEQAVLIRRMKVFLKETLSDRNKYQQCAKTLQHTHELREKDLEQKVRELQVSNQQNTQRIQELQTQTKSLKHQAHMSNEAREKIMQEHNDMMLRQHADLRQRLEIESEKSTLHIQMSQQNHEITTLRANVDRLEQELKLSVLAREAKENELKTTREQCELEYRAKLDDQATTINVLRQEGSSKSDLQQAELAKLREIINSMNNDTTTALLEKQALEAETRIVRQQLTQKVEVEADLRRLLKQKDEELSNTLQGIHQMQEFANSATRQLKEEKNALEMQLRESVPKIADLEAYKTSQLLEAQQLRNQITTLRENQVLAQSLAQKLQTDAETANSKLQEVVNELRAEQKYREKVETDLSQARNEYTAVYAQMEAVRSDAKNTEYRHQQDVERLEKDRKQHTQAMQHKETLLKEKIETLEEDKVALEGEVRTLKDTKTTARTEDLQKLVEVSKEVEILRLRLKEQTLNGTHYIAAKDEIIAELEEKVQSGEIMRRKMHNTIQELRGNVRVYTRTRPFLTGDGEDTSFSPIACQVDQESLVLRGRDDKAETYHFKFDRVFSPTAGQDDVFTEVSEFVQSSIDGYHVCLFSYGQTGSGKTHTMQGSGNNQMRGIIPRSIEKVLVERDKQSKQGWKYNMHVSFLEIYNETIRDLLNSTSAEKVDAKKYQIKQKGVHSKEVYVTELTMVEVETLEKVEWLMEKATRQRSVGSTDMNEQSSRSHSVFTLHIDGFNTEQGISLKGKLNLVDLAGSERLSRSGATGDRMKETQAINKSLSCLADVFTALGNKSSHVPFRNSKLTYLLQSCLSGDGKTLMMVNLSPTQKSYNESLCSLRFAKKVNQCELGKAKRQVSTKTSSTVDDGAAEVPESKRSLASRPKSNSVQDLRATSRNRGSSVPPSKHC